MKRVLVVLALLVSACGGGSSSAPSLKANYGSAQELLADMKTAGVDCGNYVADPTPGIGSREGGDCTYSGAKVHVTVSNLAGKDLVNLISSFKAFITGYAMYHGNVVFTTESSQAASRLKSALALSMAFGADPAPATASAQPTAPMQPAESAIAATHTRLAIGHKHTFANGVEVTVTAIGYKDDRGTQGNGKRISVTAHVSNPTGSASVVPNFKLVCSNATDTGDSYMDSTLSDGAELPARTFRDGDVILGQPSSLGDGLSTAAPIKCKSPALEISNSESTGSDIADIAFPAKVLQ